MHVVIINGSPRVQKLSNTDKIITAFGKGLTEHGATFERHAISRRDSWDAIREAYSQNEEILFALPLFVESAPGLLLEFLETLPRKDEKTRTSFLLQSGFAEGCQLRCGEAFLTKLPQYLGTRYGGCLVRGNNFGIRILDTEQKQEKATAPYEAMGALFAQGNGFFDEQAARFAGPEVFPAPVRAIVGFAFKTFGKKTFASAAESWGCTVPLDQKIPGFEK